MEIIKVVLTGGPCAGKTTALNSIKKYLVLNNIPFITVPETATEIILNGMKCDEKLLYEFQSIILRKQISKEQLAEEYARKFYKFSEKCIIIYDRGLIDNKAYLKSKEDFTKLLTEYGLEEIDILDEYNLVLDLLSLATCKKEAYNLLNEARMENADTASELDKRTSLAWIHHRNIKIIDSSVSLEEETEIILNYIKEILSDTQTKTIRRFLINDTLSDYEVYNSDNSEELYITDYFLEGPDNTYNYVISKREYKNEVSYIYSIYTEYQDQRILVEDRKISKKEYYELIRKHEVIDKIERREINFMFNHQKFTLCFYEDYTILEINNDELDRELVFPNNLEITNEITKENKLVRARRKR